MFKILAAHFRKVGRAFTLCSNEIATGIQTDDQDLKQTGFRRLMGLLISRLILWGIIGFFSGVRNWELLKGYAIFVTFFYIIAAVITASTPAPEPPKQEVVTTPSDDIKMKHAKEGRNALLDYISIVCESLIEQMAIYRPGTRDELAYPSLNRCIHMEKGVPVVSVQLHYEGEIDPAQFKERFNDRMAQKLDSGTFSSKPPAIFYEKDGTPHTAIQAIRCVPLKGKKSLRLDVVRVNEAALALMDDVERESQSEVVAEEQLDDGEL